MAAIARNNAFGAGAPSWNLSFPAGEITAAEITAYCPHWLKSIDVVNRFLSHGARTIHIAALLNEFRSFPDNKVFNTNSTLVMMSYAMRKAGFDGWCVMKHFDFSRDHFLPESGLNVTNFRTPCMTQPRDKGSEASSHATNQEVRPVAFKDLAKHVKKHPSGDDALDLARCVQYAVEHPDEVWLFPTDFQRLTAHLGGPATITPNHLDEEVFARRGDVKLPTTKRKRSAAIKPISSNKQSTNKQPTKPRRFIHVVPQPGPSNPRKRGNDYLSKDTNSAEECEAGHKENEPFGQLAKKRKLSRGRATYNAFLDDEEFLPAEVEANEYTPVGDFSAPEQNEQPQSEVERSIALRKARDGKRAAVEPDTAAPQFDVEPNTGSLQTDFLDCEPVLNFSPRSNHQSNLPSNFSQQLDGVSNHAQNSNVASGYGQMSSVPNVCNQQSGFAPIHRQQPGSTPTYGQNLDIPSTYIQQSHHPSGYDQQSSFPSVYPQKADLTKGYGQKANSILGSDQQLNPPSAYGQQTNLPSTSAQQPVLPSNFGWQSISTPNHTQQSFACGNGQPLSFTTGYSQNTDAACNANQKSIFAPGYDPMEPNFAPNFDASQFELPLSFVPNDYQQPFSLPSTFAQAPLDFASILDPNTLSSAPMLNQIPLDFIPTFEQKPSDFNPNSAAQQVELPNLVQQYTPPYEQSYEKTDTAAADPLPAFLAPPNLPANRLQITGQNLQKYALPPFRSQSDMFTTAFHYKRFGNARQSAPYRELHALCCLDNDDMGDWAENIRFAKEQWVYYGSIWTEFPGHLEKIRKARQEWGWKSTEAIRADALNGSRAA